MNHKTEVWQQASEVFEEISQLSVQQALAHVYGIKNLSLEVQQAVITLINSGNQASDFYQENIANKFNINLNNSLQIGQKLGEYELIELLGQGGMSQVFKAKRTHSETQKLVAIKIFIPQHDSAQLLHHFINEQKILSQFSHPNIVDMLHGGKTDEGVVYLVMELINQAQPLDKYCQVKSLTHKQKIDYIHQCAQALAYSHDNLIIHRDIKPDNILINQQGQLKIVDFGIAKLINKQADAGTTTIMALTPSFAAPEQINSAPITVKTDVFSLAIVALTVLNNGNLPLPKDRMIKSCAGDQQHLDKLIKNLKIDTDLKNILTQASQVNAQHRYANMHAFAEDLGHYLHNLPVKATSPSWLYRVQKFAQRRAALFATLMTFAFFLIIGSTVGYLQYQQIKIEAKKADFVKQFMLQSFRSTNPNLSKGVEISAKDLLKASAEKLNNETNLDSQIQFELLQTLGIAYGAIGVPEKAIELLKKSLILRPDDSKSQSYLVMYMFDYVDAKTLDGFLQTIQLDRFTANTDIARVLRVRAKNKARNADIAAALDDLNQALELNKIEHDSIEEMLSAKLMAEFYFLQSQPQKGIEILKSSLQKTDETTPLTLILGLKSDLGTLYNDIGEYDLALTELSQSVAQIRTVMGDKNLELSKVLAQISGTYRSLGEMDKAKTAADESYQINLAVFGGNNINTALSLNMLAVLAYQSGDIPTAITQMKQAIKIFESQQSDQYTDTLELKTNLAALLNLSNRDAEALVLLREIHAKQMDTFGQQHNATIYSQQILARTLAKLNQLPEALQLAENAAENAKQFLDEKNPLIAGALFTLAKIYQQDNQLEKALALYQEIDQNNLLKPTHPNYAVLLQSLAALSAQTQDTEHAIKYYQRSIEQHRQLYSNKNIKTLLLQLEFAQYLQQINQPDQANAIKQSLKAIVTAENIQHPELLKALQE